MTDLVPRLTEGRSAAGTLPSASQSEVWHALEGEQALLRAGSTTEGLSSQEAEMRLSLHGPNVIEKRSTSGPIDLLLRQLADPLIYVLLGSGLLALALGKIIDGLVVLGVVALNTLIGFVQEHRAAKAIEALIDLVPESADVLRDGRRESVPVASLVPGDVVLLASGDKVPADLRLIGCRNLRIEEAALTGESTPAEKQLAPTPSEAPLGDRTNMAYSGTLVSSGTGQGVVVSTGSSTELGRISTMLEEAADLETPLTRSLAQVGKAITIGILALSAVILLIGTWRVMAATGAGWGVALRENVMFAIALAVGAIPEGLPAIVTIALAIGVQRMARRRAVIRRLPAVETLGSTTVICSDKTGTLTRNEMTVQEVWTPESRYDVTGVGYQPTGEFLHDGRAVQIDESALALLRAAALCSDAELTPPSDQQPAWSITGDPTEGALVVAAEKAGIRLSEAKAEFPRIDVLPFESEHQYMATLHDSLDGRVVFLKGAPEVVLARCAFPDDRLVHEEIDRMASRGMRVLAVASRPRGPSANEVHPEDVQSGMKLLGLVGMIDPPRPEAIEAVRNCHAAGISVKMITGDHRATAEAIGEQLGLSRGEPAITGAQLAKMSNDELREASLRTNVFARVAPEHKLRLVRALQEEGHVVAMTGDGVNDAPALKQANIGVAMGITGTAVTKESGDIVLTDDNFASIAAAVEEGRRVYDNLVKSLAFVLPTNLGLAMILMFGVLFNPFDSVTKELILPMLPTQLLWINLVATVALALPLAFEAREPDVMRRPPRDPKAPVLSRFVLWRTVLAAVAMSLGAIGLFQYEYNAALNLGLSHEVAIGEAQTMAVTTVIMFQIFYMLHCRSLLGGAFAGILRNKAVFLGIAAVLLLQLAFIYAPPLQSVFGSVGLVARDLLFSTLVGALILPLITLEKRLRSPRT